MSSPLEPIPLDKNIDILDHFRNIYSTPSLESFPPKPDATSTAGHVPNIRSVQQSNVRHVHGVATLSKDYDNDLELNNLRGLAKRDLPKWKKKQTSEFPPTMKIKNQPKEHSSVRSPPKVKRHADGCWVTLAAYSNYKEAEPVVALFEALSPTESVAGQCFPSHSTILPPVKKKPLLFSNAPVTKESILHSKQQDLPKVRIARDLGRMQWIVECNDISMKKVFERRIGKRLQHGQGAGKLLTHLSSAKQPAVGLGGYASPGKEKGNASASSPGGVSATSSHPPTSPRKQLEDKKSVPDIPQSLIFNKNSKRVSGHMQVHYVPPRVSYDGTQQSGQRKTSTTSTASVSAQGNHIDHQENSAKCHRGPLTFRAALQKYS